MEGVLIYSVSWQSPKTAHGSIFGERNSVQKKVSSHCSVQAGAGTGPRPSGNNQAGGNIQLLEPWTSSRSVLGRFCETIFIPDYFQDFLILLGCLYVNRIAGVELALLESNMVHGIRNGKASFTVFLTLSSRSPVALQMDH